MKAHEGDSTTLQASRRWEEEEEEEEGCAIVCVSGNCLQQLQHASISIGIPPIHH